MIKNGIMNARTENAPKEGAPSEVIGADDYQPLYEYDESGCEAGARLVLTPWMLLDALKECEADAECLLALVQAQNLGAERRYGIPINPVAQRAERLHFGVRQLLRLLWRSGLWTQTPVTQTVDAEGNPCFVLSSPFTDGKPHGRTLHPDAPQWQRELLGVGETSNHAPPAAARPTFAAPKLDLVLCGEADGAVATTPKNDLHFEMA